jgi:hypothetical protein
VLNQGKVCPESPTRKALAVTLVEQVCAECADIAKPSDIMGVTSLRAEGETTITRQILGPVFATLTPKDGSFRQPPTPKAPRRRRGQDAG